MPEFFVLLHRWERQICMVDVTDAKDEADAKRKAIKAARSMNWGGYEGQSEVDTTTPIKVELSDISVTANGQHGE